MPSSARKQATGYTYMWAHVVVIGRDHHRQPVATAGRCFQGYGEKMRTNAIKAIVNKQGMNDLQKQINTTLVPTTIVIFAVRQFAAWASTVITRKHSQKEQNKGEDNNKEEYLHLQCQYSYTGMRTVLGITLRFNCICGVPDNRYRYNFNFAYLSNFMHEYLVFHIVSQVSSDISKIYLHRKYILSWLPVSFRLPITDYRSPITDYRLPITDYRLPITDYRLPITDYRLPIADKLPKKGVTG